jgi:LPXTG-motif cell wall-anchored protein
MMKRLVLVLGVVAALLFMAAPANADGYPPSDRGAPPAEQPVVARPSAPSAAPSGALPRTGDDSSMTMARVAIVLVAAGGLLVLAARRRHANLA